MTESDPFILKFFNNVISINKLWMVSPCSANGQPAELYEVLTLMGCEQKTFAPEDMLQDNSGRTFLTAWLTPASNSATQVHDGKLIVRGTRILVFFLIFKCLVAESEGSWLVIDGIQLDPVNLAAVGPDGTILTPSRMSVTELRAELAARQGPLQGNKKELVRQLQKARAEAKVIGGEVEDDKSQSKKVRIRIIMNLSHVEHFGIFSR